MFVKKDVYLTATQAADALGISKEDIYKLESVGLLTGYKGTPADSRSLFSMREVNRYNDQRLAVEHTSESTAVIGSDPEKARKLAEQIKAILDE